MAGGRRLSVGNNNDCEMFYTLFPSKSDGELTAQSLRGRIPAPGAPVVLLSSIRILVVIVSTPSLSFLH